MRIEAVCEHCNRAFLLDQLLEGPIVTGKCPWCETPLAPHYTELLPVAVEQAERSSSELLSALALLAGNGFRFRIVESSITGPIRLALEEHDRHRTGP